jgi:amino acid adenylation domain-containing protein
MASLEPASGLPVLPGQLAGATARRAGHWREAAQACHSLVVRVPGPGAPIRLPDRLKMNGSRWAAIDGLPVWEVRRPADSHHPSADALALREATRPLRPAGPPLRVVAVRYGDGAIDLVLVAIRARVPRWVLERIAVVLVANGTPDPPEPPRQAPAGRPARAAAMPPASVPWGLGDPARAGTVGTLPLGVPAGWSVTDRTLVAAVAVTLSRYDPDEDPTIGLLAPDRDLEMIVCSLRMDDGAGVTDLLRQCDRTLLGGDEPAPPSQPGPPVGMAVGEAIAGHRYLPCLAPVFPLTLCWERGPDGALGGTCQYDEDIVSVEMAGRFTGDVVTMAARLADSAEGLRLGDLTSLPEPEAREILRLGATPVVRPHRPGPQSIHERLAEVTRQYPDALAVTDDRVELTYRELDAQADRLAAGLRALGAAPGDLVGVCLERDCILIATLLAVLKAGCAYVPMDVRYPDERLRYTATDAGVSLVVGTDRFPAIDGLRVTGPAELDSLGSTEPAAPPVASDGASPAYAIYTSGSTGRPKGVVIPHRNVLSLIEATRDDFALGPDDVWTMFHSSAFDFSVWEIWGCLLTGGRLVVVPYWITRDTDQFHELLVRERVTVLNQTPSAFSTFIEVDRRATGELRVRLVIFGGEPLDGRMLLPWFTRHPYTTCRPVNMFGITETTVHVTAQNVTPAAAAAGSRSVGRALPGWSVSIRDERGRVRPVGVAGEIYVGGAGVASHYLGQPELTARRFVVDRLTGDRVYRSGDKGRMRPNGTIEHLGRLDNQVKVRGHRIELDEIREVLLAGSAVAAAAVVFDAGARDNHASANIHAYVVLEAGGTTREAHEHTRRVLPDYMVPATVTAIESIPLTINGKLDAARLPSPRHTATAAGAGTPATLSTPATTGDLLADRILRLWSELLEVEVGVGDNFFELGGNSLLVIRMLAELRQGGLPRVQTRQFYLNSVAGQFIELVRSARDQRH